MMTFCLAAQGSLVVDGEIISDTPGSRSANRIGRSQPPITSWEADLAVRQVKSVTFGSVKVARVLVGQSLRIL